MQKKKEPVKMQDNTPNPIVKACSDQTEDNNGADENLEGLLDNAIATEIKDELI